MHHPGPSGGDIINPDACGEVNAEAIQQVLAAKWALDVINNQSRHTELKIGKTFQKYSPFNIQPPGLLAFGIGACINQALGPNCQLKLYTLVLHWLLVMWVLG